jgi:hypothetical protein
VQSESIAALAAALAKAQSQIQTAKRDSENPFYRSRYADLASVWEACRAALTAQQLAVVQTLECAESGTRLSTTLVHSSGEWIRGESPIHGMRQTKDHGWVGSDDPQALSSAVTYARRRDLAAMVGVAPDDDDDGEAAMARPPAERQEQAQRAGTACPQCGVVGSIIKGKEEYGGGWLCYAKKGGCGAKWKVDPATIPAASQDEDPAADYAPDLAACEPLLAVCREAETVADLNRVVKALTGSQDWQSLGAASQEHVKTEVGKMRRGLAQNGAGA